MADCIGIWLPDNDSVDMIAKRLSEAGIEPLHLPELVVEWGDYYAISYRDPDNFVITIFHTAE